MNGNDQNAHRSTTPLLVLGWLWVSLPFAYGLYQLVLQTVPLFGG